MTQHTLILALVGTVLLASIISTLRSRTNILGTPPINIFLFILGKAAIIAAIIPSILQGEFYDFSSAALPPWLAIVSLAVLTAGAAFAVLGILTLGPDLRVGIPETPTALKTRGIYRVTRNPVYVGIDLMAIASAAYTMNILVALAAIICILIHQLIILAEEHHLRRHAGLNYIDYCKKTPRYLLW